jgi:FkbH-like protein
MTKDVVLLGDKTLSLLARNLNSHLRQAGSRWNVVDAGYDTWLVAPLDPRSALFEKNVAAWAFALSPRVLDNVADVGAQIDGTLERLAGLSAPPTVLFANLFADPLTALPLSGNLERHAAAARINERLLAFRESHPWFHVVDQVGLALRHGLDALHDPRFEATAQVYYSPPGTRLLSALWVRALRSLERPPRKVCVVDLDNTLWGGILGEDGPQALQMADSGGGVPYRKFQRSLLELKRAGIVLAVCSKNNYDEAMAVLQSHPDCLLRPSDFAHLEIGWGSKSDALGNISRTLGLGLDSFLFVDDSPVERAEIARLLPAVDVLEFPHDPAQLVSALNAYSGFDALRQTDEDRLRADSYQQEAQRSATRASAASPEEFFRSLELRLEIFSARTEHATRLHQLLSKTNQFNLTAERLSAEEFRGLLADPACLVLGMRVSDRFGDSGITGLAIIDKGSSGAWTVQNFLLSCRVIGRTVENAFLSWIIALAARLGASSVAFRYRRTDRNQVARGFLESSGGTEAGDRWSFDVRKPAVLPQHFVTVDESQVS